MVVNNDYQQRAYGPAAPQGGHPYRLAQNLTPQQKVGLLRAVSRLLRDRNRAGAFRRFMESCGVILWPAYVMSPVDAVPEVLLGGLGYIDDAGVVAWIVRLIIMAWKYYRYAVHPDLPHK